MSHRHSAQLQRRSNTALCKERIWGEVANVWNDTVSAEVARYTLTLTLILTLCPDPYPDSNTFPNPNHDPRSFILAFRIMKLIIAEQGNNAWLAHGTPHLNVRNDYVDTATGIKRRNTWGSVTM